MKSEIVAEAALMTPKDDNQHCDLDTDAQPGTPKINESCNLFPSLLFQFTSSFNDIKRTEVLGSDS